MKTYLGLLIACVFCKIQFLGFLGESSNKTGRSWSLRRSPSQPINNDLSITTTLESIVEEPTPVIPSLLNTTLCKEPEPISPEIHLESMSDLEAFEPEHLANDELDTYGIFASEFGESSTLQPETSSESMGLFASSDALTAIANRKSIMKFVENGLRTVSTKDMFFPFMPQVSDIYVYDLKITSFSYTSARINLSRGQLVITLTGLKASVNFKWVVSALLSIFGDKGFGKLLLGDILPPIDDYLVVNHEGEPGTTAVSFRLKVLLHDNRISGIASDTEADIRKFGLALNDRRKLLTPCGTPVKMIINALKSRFQSLVLTSITEQVTHIVNHVLGPLSAPTLRLSPWFKPDHFLSFKVKKIVRNGAFSVMIENEILSRFKTSMRTCSDISYSMNDAAIIFDKCFLELLSLYLSPEPLLIEKTGIVGKDLVEFASKFPSLLHERPIGLSLTLKKTPVISISDEITVMLAFNFIARCKKPLSDTLLQLAKVDATAMLKLELTDTLEFQVSQISVSPLTILDSIVGPIDIFGLSKFIQNQLKNGTVLSGMLYDVLRLSIPAIPFANRTKVEVRDGQVRISVLEWE